MGRSLCRRTASTFRSPPRPRARGLRKSNEEERLMIRQLTVLIAALALAGGALGAEGEKSSTGLDMQKARAEGLATKGKKAYYPADKWDLSDLPAYVPQGKVSGTIRLWGSNYIVDGNLGDY